jgi:5-methyltetrahydropteroyltriglutamate--homocysteine methyltransferase
MLRSRDRILTTHIGSLPRPDDLLRMMQQREAGQPVDQAAFARRVESAVKDVVDRQIDLGIDIVDDGEQGKPSFVTYINSRLGGFTPGGPRGNPWRQSREGRAFPDFYASVEAHASGAPGRALQMVCTAPIRYTGQAELQAQLDTFRQALGGRAAEAFVPSIAPSNVEGWNRNEYYPTEDAYLLAIGEALREEYEAIVAAGFLLQIDDPAMATRYTREPDESVEQCRRWARTRVGVLNHALRNIPPDRVRFHTCYSINMGPRATDMELKDLIDIMLEVRAGAFSFEAANPRHEHEWRLWGEVAVPEGAIIIPGVISHTTVLVEHPEVVAERLIRYAEVVGRDNVIAGADCGFASFAASHEMHPSIVWAKLAALVEGARIASGRLWPRS